MELALQDDDLPVERVWTVEELRENLFMGITTLVRQASGIRDPREYELVYGKAERQLRLVVDHLLILAAQS